MNQRSEKIDHLWALIGILSIGWAGMSIILSWLGIFHALFFMTYALVGVFLLWKKRQVFLSTQWKDILILVACLTVATVFSSFLNESTFFTGRDQGSISQASIELSHNHSLYSSTIASKEFFSLYGPGKALNFPGFYYSSNGDLITQFPLPAITWYASFISLFGLKGFQVGNTILIFLFLSSFAFLGKRFSSGKHSILFIALCASSFPIYWFSRFTLSENFMLAILWISIWSITVFLSRVSTKENIIDNPEIKMLLGLVICALTLLSITRIEGLAIVPLALFILWRNRAVREYRATFGRGTLFVAIAIFGIFAINMYVSSPFYVSIAKAIMKSSLVGSFAVATPEKSDFFTQHFLLAKLFALYGLLPSLFAGLTALTLLLWKKHPEKKRLVPILLVSPTLIYILHSFISRDHPWMLRRFAFSVAPVLVWYAALFIADLFKKKKFSTTLCASAIATALLAANIAPILYFFPYKGNGDLLNQTEKIANRFKDTDLILVDRMATGDPWIMLAGPIHSIFHKNAVYFFNPNDALKINEKNFSDVFLLVPESNIAFYQNSPLWDKMRKEDSIQFSLNHLKEGVNEYFYPAKETLTQQIILFRLSLKKNP